MIGTAIAKCSHITSSNPWTIDASKHYHFKITEAGTLDYFGNLGSHCDNPRWEHDNDKAWDINGIKIYFPLFESNVELPMATASTPGKVDIEETKPVDKLISPKCSAVPSHQRP